MQKRLNRLLQDTISYIGRLEESPFREDAIDDSLRDLKSCAVLAKTDRSYLDTISGLISEYSVRRNYESLRMKLQELEYLTRHLDSSIYVDFIILRQTHWSAIRPLVDAFRSRGCKTRIIPTPMIQEKQDHWGKALNDLVQRDGYQTEDFEEYDIETALPDIVIDNMATDSAKEPNFRFLRIASMVDNIVHIEHSILTGYNEAMKRKHFEIGRSRCWQYVVSSPLFAKAFQMILRIDGEYLPMGVPEIDSVHLMQRKFDCVKHNFQTVLWNIDALDPDKHVEGDYERLEKEIFYLEAMSEKYPKIRNIVRTHPNFCNQMETVSLKKRLDRLINERQNVFSDANPLIYETYAEVDAMVTWVSSSTLFSFGSTGKPFIIIPTFIQGGYDTMLDMHLLQVIPIAFSLRDMSDFFEGFQNDADREKRIAILQEYIGAIDGTASFKIADEVLRRYGKCFD